MPVSLSIRLDDGPVKAMMARLAPAEINSRARAGINEAVGYLQGQVQKETPVNTGALKGSIFTQVNGSSLANLQGIVATPLIHGMPMEMGRRPGRMPPSGPLELWARRKLGKSGLGFVIARAIARRGSPRARPSGYRMFEKAVQGGAAVVARIWANAFRF
jgi:hypothetical protein